nr:hypothetical protein [Saprospiraceae bacterium]
MSTINSWKAFIKAQEIFVNQYSEPFTIEFEKTDKNGLANFTIEQRSPLSNIINPLEKSFPGILQNDININDGYLLYDSSKSPQYMDELKEVADANYFEFDRNPCFSGHVSIKGNPYNWLVEINSQQPNKEGQIKATLSEIKRIDEKLLNLIGFSRSPIIGGIFKVQPSKYYIEKQYDIVNNYLTKTVGIQSFFDHGYFANLVIEDVFLKDTAMTFIKENTAYHKSHHRLIFTIKEDIFQAFLQTRKLNNIFFTSEERMGDIMGVILPTPTNNEFHIVREAGISFEDLCFDIFHFKRVFTRYFGSDSFTTKHQHIFEIDKNLFFEHFKNVVQDERFNVSVDKETISLDFTNEDELNSGLEYISALNIAKIGNKGTEHGFKIKLHYNSPLQALQDKLCQIPAIKTKLSDNGLKLSFFCFFDNHDLLQLLVAKIKDVIDPIVKDDMQYTFDELQEGKLKYFLNFKQEEFEADIISKFNYLRGEAIYLWNARKPKPFGTILKIDFPKIVIEMESMIEEICIPGLSAKVCCTLKGERDKIMRLSNTIDIIFSTSKQGILNENLPAILMDSSKATSIQGDILRTAEYKKAINDIDSSLLSMNINDRQKEAIAKCLLAKDFFLIQGPPGTGKSTAIAELIWQHIRSNISTRKMPYRVLVTSETNLAVDNALDKLRSKTHLLIKPIRFGSDDKLDKEGRRFSLESLKQWVLFGNEDLKKDKSNSNILQDWIGLISNRAKSKSTAENNQASQNWLTFLSNPNEHLRSILFNHYTKNANVIGATCSSIGKETSEQRFSRFFSDYCNIVHNKEYDAFRL